MIYLVRYAAVALLSALLLGTIWTEIVMPAFDATALALATTARPIFPQQLSGKRL